MQDIYTYLESCDNVVLASPIWFSSLSGPLLNMASRMQTYYAGLTFRGEPSTLRHKNAVLILVGAEAETASQPRACASTIAKRMNAWPFVSEITSLHTNTIPAAEDKNALRQAETTAALLHRLCAEK